MKKLFQKLKAFFERKGFEPNPKTDNVWAQAQTSSAESGTESTTSNSVVFPDDVIEELKRAKQEVDTFEKILQSLTQKTTV